MKTLYHQTQKIYILAAVMSVLVLFSCKKDKSEGGTGVPTITRVRTISKTYIDNTLTTTIVTYDSKGVATTVINSNTTPQTIPMDSTTTDGNLQNMYAIIGANLSSVLKVSFNGLSVYFNKALGSDSTILVTIPKNTPAGPTQINQLTVETLHGTASFKFNVLLPPPTVTDVSDYNFSEGSQIELTGIGLGEVTSAQLIGTSDMAAIVSKEDTKLVLKMPATAARYAALKLTYPNGAVATTQVFVNLMQAYLLFTDDYGAGWGGNFWGSGAISGEAYKSGTKSLKLTYGKGGWSANGVANSAPGLTFSADYKYLSFYIKGGSKDYTLYLTADKRAAGYGNSDDKTPILVPANVWTYYKLPIADLKLWEKGSPLNAIGFWIKGPDTQDENFYLDDFLLLK